MKEIKFRAWCINSKEMAFVDRIDFSGKYVWLLAYEGEEDQAWLERFEHVSLMQYTGQKDRNGTEIYEGDILDVILHGGEHEGYIIQWDEGYSSFEAYNKDGSNYILGGIWDKFMVVGNIHENPELMEDD